MSESKKNLTKVQSPVLFPIQAFEIASEAVEKNISFSE
jgi:hypothetical protein